MLLAAQLLPRALGRAQSSIANAPSKIAMVRIEKLRLGPLPHPWGRRYNTTGSPRGGRGATQRGQHAQQQLQVLCSLVNGTLTLVWKLG